MKTSKRASVSVSIICALLMVPIVAQAKTATVEKKIVKIYFDSFSAQLDAKDKAKISQVKSELKLAESITVTGYVGPQGSENTVLDLQRAKSVRTFLKSLGVTTHVKIRAGGHPKANPNSPKSMRAVISYTVKTSKTQPSTSSSSSSSQGHSVTVTMFLSPTANQTTMISSPTGFCTNNLEWYHPDSIILSQGSNSRTVALTTRPDAETITGFDFSNFFGNDYSNLGCKYTAVFNNVKPGTYTVNYQLGNPDSANHWGDLIAYFQDDWTAPIINGNPAFTPFVRGSWANHPVSINNNCDYADFYENGDRLVSLGTRTITVANSNVRVPFAMVSGGC